MMDCDKAREAISSSMDGEPLGIDVASLDTHLDTCESCREYAQQVVVLDERLRAMPTVGIDAMQSSSRWAKLRLALDDHDRKQLESTGSNPAWSRVGRRRILFAGLSSAAAAVVVGGIGISLLKPGDENVVATEAVNDFLTFRASGKTLHVMDGNPANVKQWLASRVSFDIPIDPTPPDGFTLSGGRLCSFLERRLVFFYYQRQEQAVSVYLMDEDGLALPKSKKKVLAGKEVSVASLNGVTHVMFRRDGLIYVVVSNLQAAELLAFAADI